MLAGCTTGADSPSATVAPPSTTTTMATTTTSPTSTEAVAAFGLCMSERGVDIGEIPFDATGRPRLDLVMITLDFSEPAVSEAVSLCSENLEAGALDLSDDQILKEVVVERLAEFSRCMVERGVEGFPEPVPGYLGVGSPFPTAQIPYSDPEFGPAVTACRASLLEALTGETGGS